MSTYYITFDESFHKSSEQILPADAIKYHTKRLRQCTMSYSEKIPNQVSQMKFKNLQLRELSRS